MADPPDNPDHLIPLFDPSSNQLQENDTDQQPNNFPLEDDGFELPALNPDTHEYLYFLGDTEYLRLGNHPSQPPQPSSDQNEELNLNSLLDQSNPKCSNPQHSHLHISLSDDLPNIQNIQQPSSPLDTIPITTTSQPSTHLLPNPTSAFSPSSTKRPRPKNSSIQQTPRKIAPRVQDIKFSDNPSTPLSMQTSSRPLDLATRNPISSTPNNANSSSHTHESSASAVSPHLSTLQVSNPNQHLSQFSLGLSPQPMTPLTNIGASMYPVQRQQGQGNPSRSPQNQLNLPDINQTNTDDKHNKRSRSNKHDETDGKQTQNEQPELKKLRINDNTPTRTNQPQQRENQNPQQQQLPFFQPQPQFVSPGVPLIQSDMMMLNYPNMFPNLHMQMMSSGRYPPGFIGQIPPNNLTATPNFICHMPPSTSGIGLVPDPSQLRLANTVESPLALRPQPSQHNNSSTGPVPASDDGTQVQQQTHAKLERHPVLGRWQLRNTPGGNLGVAASITTSGNDVVKESPHNQNNNNRPITENQTITGTNATQTSNQVPSSTGEQTRSEHRTQKKQRLVWTPDLHERFLKAIDAVGLAQAVPKTLVSHMNVDGLTTEHVKSHLQKYRNSLRKEAMEDGKERDKQTDDAGRSTVGGRNSKGSVPEDESGSTDDAKVVGKTNSSDKKHVSKVPNQGSGQGTSLKDESACNSGTLSEKIQDQSAPVKPPAKKLDELSPIHERRRRSCSPTIAAMAQANQISLQPMVNIEKLKELTDKKHNSGNEDELIEKKNHGFGLPIQEQGTTEPLIPIEDENKKLIKDSTLPSSQDIEGVTETKTENREAKEVGNDEKKQDVNSCSPPKDVLTNDMEIDQIGCNENESNLEMVKDKIMKLKLLVQKFEFQVSTMDRRLQKKTNYRRGNVVGKKDCSKLPIEADSGATSVDLAAEVSRTIETEDIEILKDIRVNMQKNIEEVYSSLDSEIDRRRKIQGDDYG